MTLFFKTIVVSASVPFLVLGDELPSIEKNKTKQELVQYDPVLSNFTFNYELVSFFKDILKLDDGSEWKISAFDRYKVKSWSSGDHLVIRSSNKWFSLYRYKIINQTIGSVVEANVSGRSEDNALRHIFFHGFDKQQNMLMLMNQKKEIMYWMVAPPYQICVDTWKIKDPLIFGYNSEEDASIYKMILINVKNNLFVKCNLYSKGFLLND